MLSLDKKGVSVMIGYILLVSMAVILGIIVYSWMKSYVPSDIGTCPEGVSLEITNWTYPSCSSAPSQASPFTIKIKNNGRFDLAGYFIYATTSRTQELATKNMYDYLFSPSNLKDTRAGAVVLPPAVTKDNTFSPNTILPSHQFSWSSFKIFAIEIIPLRFQTQGNKKRIISCEQAKIRLNLELPTACG